MSNKKTAPEYWYNPELPIPALSRYASFLYKKITHYRRAGFLSGRFKSHHPGVPVIVVGNISVGGTGKTPLTIALVEKLQQAGWKPGVASRGYGRLEANVPRWVEANTPFNLSGDEPALIAQKTGVPVRVDAKRVDAANALVERGCNIIISDDGLQHYPLARDIEIEVIDAARGYGNGELLPAGPLREPISRALLCDFRILNLSSSPMSDINSATAPAPSLASVQDSAGFGQWPMQLHIQGVIPLKGGRVQSLSRFAGQRVHAVAGIGHPERFFATLRHYGMAPIPHSFPDHYLFQASDLEFSGSLPILMTEKDAIKCKSFAPAACYSVPITAELPEQFWQALFLKLEKINSK